uniref:Uncharacterized protein n=1 Tax=Helianthus annuus TaxID=4232 RepID=A0A251SIR8_HELAN
MTNINLPAVMKKTGDPHLRSFRPSKPPIIDDMRQYAVILISFHVIGTTLCQFWF